MKPRVRRAMRRRTVAPVVRTFDFENRAQPQALLHRLEDNDLFVRQVAAVALARLSELHPARLVYGLERIAKALHDDSAYVRWHVVYVLSRVIAFSPSRASALLDDLLARLGDDNKIVRVFAYKALRQIEAQNPSVAQQLSKSLNGESASTVTRPIA